MFCDFIIQSIPELIKFFKQLNLFFYFTKPQISHMQSFLIAMMFYAYQGKLSNVSDFVLHAHRTSIGRFLDTDSFQDDYLLKQMKTHVINQVFTKAKQTGLPIYVIVDDTICEKTVPSSKVRQPIDGCGFHQSHLQHKTVYGHQFVTVMLRCGGLVLPYATVLYEKEKESKIQLAKQLILSLPEPVCQGYVLSDSWYSCQELFDASREAGYHYLGALKVTERFFQKDIVKRGYKWVSLPAL